MKIEVHDPTTHQPTCIKDVFFWVRNFYGFIFFGLILLGIYFWVSRNMSGPSPPVIYILEYTPWAIHSKRLLKGKSSQKASCSEMKEPTKRRQTPLTICKYLFYISMCFLLILKLQISLHGRRHDSHFFTNGNQLCSKFPLLI